MSGRGTPGVWRSPLHRRVTYALLAPFMIALMAIAGCASPSTASDTSRAPIAAGEVAIATPSVSVNPTVANARAQVMAAYSGYIAAETSASQTADYGSSELSKYAADPLLGQWVAELFHLHVMGDVQRGAVVSHPVIVSVNMSKTSGIAVVKDCLDQSAITVVNAQTGTAVALPKTKPFVATATLTLYSTGTWLVSRVDASAGKTC